MVTRHSSFPANRFVKKEKELGNLYVKGRGGGFLWDILPSTKAGLEKDDALHRCVVPPQAPSILHPRTCFV